uniref:Ribosome assembly protein METTL17, mitochondrial n=1 Tax=Gasterosteus aculeatus aculeatus TaxID=481459 RepID=A0AAQ4P6C0_GASAC
EMASASFGACVLCRRAAVKISSRGMSAAAGAQSQGDFLSGEPHRKHPGVTNLKTLRLPDELQAAARTIINTPVTQLTDRSRTLANFLWSRKRAVEDWTLRIRQTKQQLEENLLEERIRKKVFSELRKTTYHWTPMKYDEELAVVYMAARLAGGYAAVRRAINEIKKRDPSFAPKSLLDFGSGLGTVVWASHSCWGDTLKEMVCVDSSGPMNVLAERLLKGDEERAEPHIKQVYFRQFLPVSPKVQFDLVAAAFTLSELLSVKDREEAVLTLWRKTGSYLVLVENGTKEGHQMLMEARDAVLKVRKHRRIVSASVFAPCPHDLSCPKLTVGPTAPCNFQQMYHPLPLPGRQTEKFSYLILTRARPAQADGADWARLIAPVQRRTRHVHCRACCSDGRLQHLVVTARKHSRDVYRCARSSDWGDQLPTAPRGDDDQSDSE